MYCLYKELLIFNMCHKVIVKVFIDSMIKMCLHSCVGTKHVPQPFITDYSTLLHLCFKNRHILFYVLHKNTVTQFVHSLTNRQSRSYEQVKFVIISLYHLRSIIIMEHHISIINKLSTE